jgi:hypothetical protein
LSISFYYRVLRNFTCEAGFVISRNKTTISENFDSKLYSLLWKKNKSLFKNIFLKPLIYCITGSTALLGYSYSVVRSANPSMTLQPINVCGFLEQKYIPFLTSVSVITSFQWKNKYQSKQMSAVCPKNLFNIIFAIINFM